MYIISVLMPLRYNDLHSTIALMSMLLVSCGCRCTGTGGCACFDGWEGDSCNVATTLPPVTIVFASWCASCKANTRCINNGFCSSDGTRPRVNQVPMIRNSTLIVTLQNVGCSTPEVVFFSWGASVPVQRYSTVGTTTTMELMPPESPHGGTFLMMLPSGESWPLTFLDPTLTITCLGQGCNAPVSQGSPVYVVVHNISASSESELIVSIASMDVPFVVVSSTQNQTLLYITPPDCSACRYSSRSVPTM